jgi:uncharacterized protein (TIGR00730 family)
MRKVKSVCVYCGTGSKVDEVYKMAARALGELLAREGVRLVYGGGKTGLMGEIAQACFAAKGDVVGIIPEHVQDKEIKNTDVTEIFVVDSMHTRKRMMVDKSEAFVILPGGFGTLDETFEILTWKYMGLHDKPVVFVNVKGYYDPLLKMVDHMVNEGFTPFWQRNLFQVVDDVGEVLSAIRSAPEHIKADTRRS